MRCSVFIATSLDGYIARPDGSIDWLDTLNATVPPGEDCGYQAFMDTVDVLVMGRHTFQQVLTFDPWPYGIKPVVVLSSHGVAIPPALQATVTALNESPQAVVARLQGQGARHLYIDGGVTIQRFMAAGLVTDLTITQVPILLGAGRPLFATPATQQTLQHLHTQAYPFGFVQSTYHVPQPS